MEFVVNQNEVYLMNEKNKRIAEVTFPDMDDQTVRIKHTFVDDSLRGQGIASKLLKNAADEIRRQNKKAKPICSYAVKWFEKHPEYHDILQES